MADRRIKRALISVYDKTGIVEFARALVNEFGIEIISTGGTASLLKENGIPVTLVEQITGFPEMLDGRVKTLHPKIHAAILADRDNPDHMRQLKEQGIEPIDMVVVNLYPFEKTVADPNCTFEQAIEMIDIGGPCLLRAAAKNHKHVISVPSERLYSTVLIRMRAKESSGIQDLHTSGADWTFAETARYDGTVAEWICAKHSNDGSPMWRFLEFFNWGSLRYGENPHQAAELIGYSGEIPSEATVLSANVEDNKESEVSFNNYADAHAALELCKELSRAWGSDVLCGTGFQPVKQSWPDILTEEKNTRRNLPHFQTPGRSYFVTFRLKKTGQLVPRERDIVLNTCKFWHKQKMDLHAVVVMPDHVHILMTPLETAQDCWVSLSEIMHSIKRHSAREINKLRGVEGPLWLDESFDRIMRNEKEFNETFDYIGNNPIKAGISTDVSYPWFWHEGMEEHRLKTGATQASTILRSQAGTIQSGATQFRATRADTGHRLETGATDNHPSVCTFIKHTNACGVGAHANTKEAYRRAYLGDPNAAMGGVLACSFDVDKAFAATVMETFATWGKDAGVGGFFVEVWIAPDFAKEAVELIQTSKPWGERVRLLAVGNMSQPPDANEKEYKSITGGMLVQSRDLVGLNEEQWKVATKRKPSESELSDMRLAWLIAKHTKSNAISICKDGMLIGNGAGQMSRVMSCRIATWLAKENGHAEMLQGSVAASDAFFPFADGPNLLMDAGVTAIIQPGGSKRDEETIAACDARNVAMIFTGTRHFRH